jgi:glutamine synthetase
MNKDLELNQNHIVSVLGKQPNEFTAEDIIGYIKGQGIKMVNFMYPAADCRLKTLNFVINSMSYLESILKTGERVDGSSLFPFIEAGNSDLYVLPRFSTAFLDPFAQLPTVTMLCSFFDKDGNPLLKEKLFQNHAVLKKIHHFSLCICFCTNKSVEKFGKHVTLISRYIF